MEKKTKSTIKENGSFYTEETIRTTPEDGLVPENEIRPAAMLDETRGKHHIGYSTTKSYATNDPRVTRPFVAVFSAIFALIGGLVLLMGLWAFAAFRSGGLPMILMVFGVVFISLAIFIYKKANKDIDVIAEKLEKQGKDVTIDSKEELHEVMSETAAGIKNNFMESAEDTFTEEAGRGMMKSVMPIYYGLCVVLSILLGVVAHPVLGVVIIVISVGGGSLFHLLVVKVLPGLFQKK